MKETGTKLKNWEVKSKITPKSIDEVIGELEKLRGIDDGNRDEFYNPQDPRNIEAEKLGISKVKINRFVKLIEACIKESKDIVIFGDYDVDGVTSTAIAWETINSLGAICHPYLPDRFLEGYGLTKEVVDKIVNLYPSAGMVVCVDNGIVAQEALDYAQSKFGLDVVVIDHHETDGVKNPAKIVFHDTSVCAAALSWFVFSELGRKLNSNSLSDSQLPLAALATVCDQMNLMGVNRSVLVYGLKLFGQLERPGLICLLEEMNLQASEISTYHLGFVIGPKINAAGRMGHALEALRLLCTKNKKRAQDLCKILNAFNQNRQLETDSGIQIANSQIDHQQKIIVVVGEFHEGVIGLVASKIANTYMKPAVVIARKDIAKGSARSVEGFNITSFIRGYSGLTSVGGHSMASGFSLSISKIEEFVSYVHANSSNADFLEGIKRKNVDLLLPIELASLKLAHEISKMSPFGTGNPEPLFVIEKIKAKNLKKIGADGRHLKLNLIGDGTKHEAVYFNAKPSAFGENDDISVVCSLSINRWGGKDSLQCIIKDVGK